MSLLVHYTLKQEKDNNPQHEAMRTLVSGLNAEGILGLNYACFATDDPCHFIGLLEFPDDHVKSKFLNSAAFAAYREAIGPTLANPPETTSIVAIASTRDVSSV